VVLRLKVGIRIGGVEGRVAGVEGRVAKLEP
jgi:hypothetical protein